MGYNYASAFKPPTICKSCHTAIMTAAVVAYTSTHPGEKGFLKLQMHLEQKVVEATGSEHVFYTFKELGFDATC